MQEGQTLGTKPDTLAERIVQYLRWIAATCKGCPRKGGYCAHCAAEPAAGLVRDLDAQDAHPQDGASAAESPEARIAQARRQIALARQEQRRERVRRIAAGTDTSGDRRTRALGPTRADILAQVAQGRRHKRDLASDATSAMLTYILNTMVRAGLLQAAGTSWGRTYTITETGLEELSQHRNDHKTQNDDTQ